MLKIGLKLVSTPKWNFETTIKDLTYQKKLLTLNSCLKLLVLLSMANLKCSKIDVKRQMTLEPQKLSTGATLGFKGSVWWKRKRVKERICSQETRHNEIAHNSSLW